MAAVAMQRACDGVGKNKKHDIKTNNQPAVMPSKWHKHDRNSVAITTAYAVKRLMVKIYLYMNG